MQLLRSSWLVLVATILGVALFWLRPGGVDGPRPEPIAAKGKGFDHSPFDAVLAKARGADGVVDYAALKGARAELDAYLGQLRATAPGNAGHRFKTSDDRLAYYLNAFNAFMLATVLDHCPVTDVQSVYVAGGLFWRVSFMMGEEPITLSDLEAKIRTVMGGDPGVRLAVIKGAKGYPGLPAKAFRGETVHQQLADQARAAVALPRIARQEGATVHLSQIFEWYNDDFGKAPIQWIQRTAPGTLNGDPKAMTIVYEPFDWSLNGVCP